ncbi:hypothetical protein [Patulibacter minatonensis]|uniref:hypothetical protein n=1 Tax=Patulibacter minatonensis TaxID=298163 RepID=UPI00047BD86B|nr:hypothetical protein [Patulibacter minatonensis]
MTDWGDIVGAAELFPPVGWRHRLTLTTDLVRAVDERGPMVHIELHSDDLRLMLSVYVPVVDGAEWIAALTSLLDVPEGQVPHPDRWPEMTEELVGHRQALGDLPTLDEKRRR